MKLEEGIKNAAKKLAVAKQMASENRYCEQSDVCKSSYSLILNTINPFPFM